MLEYPLTKQLPRQHGLAYRSKKPEGGRNTPPPPSPDSVNAMLGFPLLGHCCQMLGQNLGPRTIPCLLAEQAGGPLLKRYCYIFSAFARVGVPSQLIAGLGVSVPGKGCFSACC